MECIEMADRSTRGTRPSSWLRGHMDDPRSLLPWLIVVAALIGAAGCVAREEAPSVPVLEIQESAPPPGCDPDRIVTIEAGCAADPSTLDPVYSGKVIWFKNTLEVEITINVDKALFGEPEITIPAGGGACRKVLPEPNEVTYSYWVKSVVCPEPPPLEARPRIIIRPPRQ